MSHAPLKSKRILLICDFFYPSIGGSEIYLEEIAVRLMQHGYSVEIACRVHSKRDFTHYKGIRIHQFDCSGNLVLGFLGSDFDNYRNFVYNFEFDSVFLLTHPDNWNCIALYSPPVNRPRLIYMPSINAKNVADWTERGLLPQIATILQEPDVLIAATESGFDAKFFTQWHLDHLFVPHAVESKPAQEDFRKNFELSLDKPLLLMVSNFWPLKNHLGLLDVLVHLKGSWQLVIIGQPFPYPLEMEYYHEVLRRVATDNRISVFENLAHDVTLAAIRDADILLHPSMAESAGPLVILEAMSLGTPWVATPACNAVHDQAGGVVCDLAQFPVVITKLLKNHEDAKMLGQLGKKHWHMRFTWEMVLPGYIDALENTRISADYSMPPELREENLQIVTTIMSEKEMPLSTVDRKIATCKPGDCLLDRIPFPVTCADEAMFSEKFTFLQRIFQRNIQDGNLMTVMHLGMATTIFDTSQGQAPPELLGMGYYSLLRIIEEKPYLEDVCDYIRHLSQVVKGSDPGLGEMPGWMDQFRPIRQDKIRLQELLTAFAYEEADPLLEVLAERYPGDPELLSEQTTRLIATGKEWEPFLRQREALFCGSPYDWWWYWTFGASLFRCGRYEAALEPLETSLKLRANSYTVNLLAECHYRLGAREAALGLWRESLRYDPLQIHLYMKMHDCLSGFDRMVQQDLTGEKICVLIYCWNKRDVLEATLNGLAQSDLGSADILMLDNNSTDGTGDLMEQASALFPRNRCRVIHLPTNVGAPAARNWLMAQPEARQADYIAYLDDDVDLPEDWLGRLLATLKAFPQAGVAGSRIVDPLRLPTLQYGGVFLYIAEENNLRVSGKHGNEPDYGQMNYIRSCVSVMGCCHLFRNKALYDVGEFDVRFSPSQVDDIEHDLRTVMKAYEVIYNGHNRVVHHQKTGKQAILSRAAKGNVDGNVLKMVAKHPVEETQRIKFETEERDRQYLRQKIAELRSAGLLDGVREVPFGII